MAAENLRKALAWVDEATDPNEPQPSRLESIALAQALALISIGQSLQLLSDALDSIQADVTKIRARS